MVVAIFEKVPIAPQQAQLIADLLVDTDLRGVVSHGVVQVDRYVRSYQQERTNKQPNIRVLREGPVTAALTGDGGLGMIVATEAMQKAIRMAKKMGVGVATTTYHAHLGSTGKYVRMALRENLIGISFSGRNAAPQYETQSTILGSIQGSPPLAFGMPSGPDHPPFLLDMVSHSLWNEEFFKKMPQVYFKAIGISHVANIMSGTLGGQMLSEFDRSNIKFADADQSGFFMALDVQRFVPLQAFKADMDHLMDGVSRMSPLPGFTSADLPGGPEWKKEKAYLKGGVPISRKAQELLETLAREFHLQVPWTKA
ncbi:MAG: Ldh family oxidoreductase [Acidimicrobiia bacterium]|nr:Ldh family oxidoreductase [Acidimicrobiia bacterium]